ncbi:MAG: hemerythrin domain-containing protein [Luteitalea sp.]|nr:hemerythrin domain-containing protein [Luteitalea sp.]
MLANEFSKIFREEHRCVRDALFDLIDAFDQRDTGRASSLLQQIAGCTGPHFRYEEEALYPALTDVYGAGYVEQLLTAHDGVIAAAGELSALSGKAELSTDDVERGKQLTRGILPHVSDCEGLSIMVERLPEDVVRTILDTRTRATDAGLDLMRWSREVRQRHTG